MWAWGYNGDGTLGDGSLNPSPTPVEVRGPDGVGQLTDVVAIAAGQNHSLALRSDGTVWAWGGGSNGELGNNATPLDQPTPVQVLGPGGSGVLTGVVGIAGGFGESIALGSDGSVWTWGLNDDGELGTGLTGSSPTPVKVDGLPYGASALRTGCCSFHALVIGKPPPPGAQTLPASAIGATSATLNATVNPQGSATSYHFEYGLDPSLTGDSSTIYDQATPDRPVGSDVSSHPVNATVTGLVPQALYHVRLVATNSAGSTFGPDQTFTTLKDPAPPPPTLGRTFNIEPVSGLVFIKPPPGKTLAADLRPIASAAALVKGKGFIPLTEARQIPSGSQIDARAGTLRLTTATGAKHGKTIQKGTFTGGLYSLHQSPSRPQEGLTTLSLLNDAFPGAPSFSTCAHHGTSTGLARPLAHPAVSAPVLHTLRARDHHGHFRTRTRASAGTSRGTDWTTIDRCDGTLTIVHRGTVSLFDYGKRKTIVLRAGQRYLARLRGG